MAAHSPRGMQHPYEQPWCSHPDYHVYWEHYRAMKQWYEENKESFWNSIHVTSMPISHCSCQQREWQWPTCSSMSSLSVSSSVGKSSKPKRQKLRRKRSTSRGHSHRDNAPPINNVTASPDDDYNVYEQEDENEDENFEMQITDEMIAFIEQSERHKQEMRDVRMKDEDASMHSSPEKYATVTNAYTGSLQQSCLPPRERPGALRTAEMKLLYGSDAAMIHGMETAMQLAFDRNCDLLQPKLWPNIPLNLWTAESTTGI